METIRREVEREVSGLLRIIFQDRRKTGQLDLEAVEMAMRAAMHQAGAVALSQLLRYEPPAVDEREIPCACGQTARYREMRSRKVLTAVGEVEFLRPGFSVRTAITDSSPPMSLWASKRRRCLPECAACWRWSVPKRPSIMVADRWRC